MTTFRDMANRFSGFINDLDNISLSIIESSEKEITDAIKGQLQKGTDGDNNPLRPYRNRQYADYKRTLNPLGVTDWKLTGDFYAQMRLRIQGRETFSVFSSSPHRQDLINNYGSKQMERAMTMSKESLDTFRRERFIPFLIQLAGAYTGVKIK